MLVRDIMTTDVVTVGIGAPFREVAETMLEAGVSGLPVVNSDGSVAGIVTEADLVAKEALSGRRRLLRVVMDTFSGSQSWWHKSKGLIALELMTAPAHTISADAEVHLAARKMMAERVKRLPVVDDHGRLVGIVSRADLLTIYARTDRQLDADIRALLHDPAREEPGDDIRFKVRDGVVQLKGTVANSSHRRALVAAVRAVPGVVGVSSELAETPPTSGDGDQPLDRLRHSGVGVDDPNIWPQVEAPPRP